MSTFCAAPQSSGGKQNAAHVPLVLTFAGVIILVLLFARGGTFSSYGLSHTKIFANGASAAHIRIPAADLVAGAEYPVRARHGLVRVASVQRENNGDLTITLAAGYAAGDEVIEVRGLTGGAREYALRLIALPIDLNNNGIPDAAELTSDTDRERFRFWFCSIAESQYDKIWETWNPEQRDCAGLIRFAMREALSKHDEKWFARHTRAGALLLRAAMPDVAAFQYPDIPFLGENIFRARFAASGTGSDGSYFSKSDFSSFADARVLMDYNCTYISRDIALLEEGDLLFFDQDDLDLANREDAMHIMICIGIREGETMLVYHTGDPKTGAVRKLPVSALLQHPDARWHPHAANPWFRGVFRLSIIAEGAGGSLPPRLGLRAGQAPPLQAKPPPSAGLCPATPPEPPAPPFSFPASGGYCVRGASAGEAARSASGAQRTQLSGAIRLRVFRLQEPAELLLEPAAGGAAVRISASGARLFADGDEGTQPMHVPAAARLTVGRTTRVFPAGTLEISASGGRLIVIAALPLEDYIAGVLVAEAAPWAALPHTQALQYLAAQAAACRSYAVYYANNKQGRHAGEYFKYDFCDTTHCQAWRASGEPCPENVLHAVHVTRGMVLGLAGEYAPGFYSSTAAASTVLPSEVWPGKELDKYFEPVANRLPGARELLTKESPHAAWEWREEKEKFRDFLRDAFGIAWDGALPKVEYSPRGAAQSLTFTHKPQGGARESARIPGHEFRDVFCRARHWGSVRSLHFTAGFERGEIVFRGQGLGHGVGLCQYGALALARAGRTWDAILRWYYPKLEIMNLTCGANRTVPKLDPLLRGGALPRQSNPE